MTDFVNKVEALSRRSKITLLLDANLFMLKEALRDAGFKVIQLEPSMPDEKIRELAEGTAIVTKNSRDFVNHAVADDYDVIALEHIKFVDTKKDRTNETAQKIVAAVRGSNFYSLRGNFLLTVFDDGSWDLKDLGI